MKNDISEVEIVRFPGELPTKAEPSRPVAIGPPSPEDLFDEEQAYQRYGHLFAERELREARKAGLIAYFDLRKGVFYTVRFIMDYLQLRKCEPCLVKNEPLNPAAEVPDDSFSSAGSGSHGRKKAPSSTIAGMTPQLEERAASQLVSGSLKQPKSG